MFSKFLKKSSTMKFSKRKKSLFMVFCILTLSLSACSQTEENAEIVDESMVSETEDESIHGEDPNAEDKNVDSIGFEAKYEVKAEEVVYHNDVVGYLAMPEEDGDFPGIVMIHEWWGLNDNIKKMAENYAGQGYVVLAVDLYEGEVAEEPSQAGELAGGVRSNPEPAIENMKSAVSYLKEMQEVPKIASLGWCFGGQQSLQLSLNEDVDSTVIYYGNLVTDQEELSAIENPVLGIFGAEDQSISVDDVNAFDAALDALEIENEIYIYDGVGHAFANPSGNNYAAEETEDAWMKTVDFLEKNLK